MSRVLVSILISSLLLLPGCIDQLDVFGKDDDNTQQDEVIEPEPEPEPAPEPEPEQLVPQEDENP